MISSGRRCSGLAQKEYNAIPSHTDDRWNHRRRSEKPAQRPAADPDPGVSGSQAERPEDLLKIVCTAHVPCGVECVSGALPEAGPRQAEELLCDLVAAEPRRVVAGNAVDVGLVPIAAGIDHLGPGAQN